MARFRRHRRGFKSRRKRYGRYYKVSRGGIRF